MVLYRQFFRRSRVTKLCYVIHTPHTQLIMIIGSYFTLKLAQLSERVKYEPFKITSEIIICGDDDVWCS